LIHQLIVWPLSRRRVRSSKATPTRLATSDDHTPTKLSRFGNLTPVKLGSLLRSKLTLLTSTPMRYFPLLRRYSYNVGSIRAALKVIKFPSSFSIFHFEEGSVEIFLFWAIFVGNPCIELRVAWGCLKDRYSRF